MEPIILRLPRGDVEGENFVLVHVSSVGKHPLDLKLIGTDTEAVFSVILKPHRIASWKAKNSKIEDGEWETILESVLHATIPGQSTLLEGVEAVAKVEDEASVLNITIQKRIEGITQKLGTIKLAPDEEEEINPWEWCALTIQSRDTSTLELSKIKESADSTDAQLKLLQDKLEELIQLKNANENSLLEKFSLLLNEKKLKIRDQQRLLTSSKVDPSKLAQVVDDEDNDEAVKSKAAGPSRKGKRKVAVESDSEDGFEKMDIDEPAKEAEVEGEDSEAGDIQTPDASDEETASEAEDEVAEPAPPPVKKGRAAAKGKGKELVPAKGKAKGKAATKGRASKTPPAPEPMEEDDDLVVPPRRELPFLKAKAKEPPKPADEGSETESGDDEL